MAFINLEKGVLEPIIFQRSSNEIQYFENIGKFDYHIQKDIIWNFCNLLNKNPNLAPAVLSAPKKERERLARR